jgi:hypothetical protein
LQYYDYSDKTMKKFTKEMGNCTLKMLQIFKLEVINLKKENEEKENSNSVTKKENEVFNNTKLSFLDNVYNYVEFNVIKTNKFGVKHDRILGIDGINIYNKKSLTSNRNLFAFYKDKESKTTNPTRPIKTLASVIADKDNPKSFNLCFIDENGKKIYKYFETKTKIECEEIVKRLNDLIKIYQNKN